jgi:GDP-mannose 6-dehydrogenase
MLIGKGCDVKIYDPHIQLDAIYGSNEAFLLSALPHIGRSMEKSLQSVMGWAELIVVTQDPTAEARQALAQSLVPVINVASSEPAPVARLEAV